MSKDEINTTACISYIGCLVTNVNLATNLSEFKTQFIKDFKLDKLIKGNVDEVKLNYKKGGKTSNVEDEDDYHNMLKYFVEDVNEVKERVVYVETEKIPVHFEGEKSIEFEDEIKNVVERELRIAANNIKKCLTTNLSLSNSKKVREEICKDCKKQIIGYLYKEVNPDEDSYYCELCSTKVEKPLFKIN